LATVGGGPAAAGKLPSGRAEEQKNGRGVVEEWRSRVVEEWQGEIEQKIAESAE
jgi:hypothetical protein